MLLQIQDCQRGLTIVEGVRKMAAEGAQRAQWMHRRAALSANMVQHCRAAGRAGAAAVRAR